MVFVGLELGHCPVFAVAEEDKLDAVEAEQLLAQLGGGVGDTVFARKGGYFLGVGEFRRQTVRIERPGVDVRIDTKVGSGAEEEGLGLLPTLAGLEELGADGIDLTLGQLVHAFLRGSGDQIIQFAGLAGQVAVGGVDHVRNVLFRNFLHFLLVGGQASELVVLLAAGDGGEAESENKVFFHMDSF